MYYNGFELRVMNEYKIEDLRRSAQASRVTIGRPVIRIAMAHALIAVANRIWREDVEQQMMPAPRKVALS